MCAEETRTSRLTRNHHHPRPNMNETDKNRLLISLCVFGLVVIFFQLFFNSWTSFSYGRAFLSLLLGLVAGGGTYAGMMFMGK